MARAKPTTPLPLASLPRGSLPLAFRNTDVIGPRRGAPLPTLRPRVRVLIPLGEKARRPCSRAKKRAPHFEGVGAQNLRAMVGRSRSNLIGFELHKRGAKGAPAKNQWARCTRRDQLGRTQNKGPAVKSTPGQRCRRLTRPVTDAVRRVWGASGRCGIEPEVWTYKPQLSHGRLAPRQRHNSVP
jgi:hypothetical protein